MNPLDNLRSDMNSNPSFYTTLGGTMMAGGGVAIAGMLLKGGLTVAAVSNPVGVTVLAVTAVGSGLYYLGGLKGGKFDFNELNISAAPTPEGTKIAQAKDAPVQQVAKAPDVPTQTAAITVESPSAILPRNTAETGVQTGRG